MSTLVGIHFTLLVRKTNMHCHVWSAMRKVVRRIIRFDECFRFVVQAIDPFCTSGVD